MIVVLIDAKNNTRLKTTDIKLIESVQNCLKNNEFYLDIIITDNTKKELNCMKDIDSIDFESGLIHWNLSKFNLNDIRSNDVCIMIKYKRPTIIVNLIDGIKNRITVINHENNIPHYTVKSTDKKFNKLVKKYAKDDNLRLDMQINCRHAWHVFENVTGFKFSYDTAVINYCNQRIVIDGCSPESFLFAIIRESKELPSYSGTL